MSPSDPEDSPQSAPKETSGETSSGGLSTGLVISLAALAGIVLGAVLWILTGPGQKPSGEVVSRAAETDLVTIGGPFSLTNQDGERVTDETYHGAYTLVYFGYTYCPDVCPLGLLFMQDLMDGLGKAGQKVQPVFITVDPDRDTPQVMKSYISSFHPRLQGLTGTPEEIAAVLKEYRVYARKALVAGSEDPMDYTMDHMSVFYLMGPDGKHLTQLVSPTDLNQAVAQLKKYIK